MTQQTLTHLAAENFLSFRELEVDFKPLNVLVGQNGAGKTNVLKAFQFLGDVARQDLTPAIAAFGGLDQLVFRGRIERPFKRRTPTVSLLIKGQFTKNASSRAPDEYKLSFWRTDIGTSVPQRSLLQRSETFAFKRTAGRGRRITLSGNTAKFEVTGDRPQTRQAPGPLSVQKASTGLATLRKLGENYEAEQVEQIAQVFEQLRLFEIDVELVRRPNRYREADRLRADGGNLAPFLFYLSDAHKAAFQNICEDVRFVLPGFEKFVFTEIGGSDSAVRVDVVESGLKEATPLARVSFGTIRAIALFAMLHDPQPPSLTCLEEIDHGLHPYALDLLVERLREASKISQFILATHSPALVNRLSDDELIVVERAIDGTGSRIFKPSAERVKRLHDETGYELGELWFSGLLGAQP